MNTQRKLPIYHRQAVPLPITKNNFLKHLYVQLYSYSELKAKRIEWLQAHFTPTSCQFMVSLPRMVDGVSWYQTSLYSIIKTAHSYVVKESKGKCNLTKT